MSSLTQDEITQVSPHQLSKVIQQIPEGIMVQLQYQLDWICHHLGDTSLGTTVREVSGVAHWRGQMHPGGGWHHHVD